MKITARVFATISVIACLLSIVSCSDSVTQLVVEIVSHPHGGFNVKELGCTMRGKLEGGDEHIETIIEWWWSDTLGQNEQVLKQETHTFFNDEWEQYTTTIEAPTYFYLFQLFWVKIKWEDEDGTEHEIESDKAHCKILGAQNVFPFIVGDNVFQ
jgi:hypothetical protein